MNFLIAFGHRLHGAASSWCRIFFALMRAFGFYAIVEEGTAHVYVLFGKVLAVH